MENNQAPLPSCHLLPCTQELLKGQHFSFALHENNNLPGFGWQVFESIVDPGRVLQPDFERQVRVGTELVALGQVHPERLVIQDQVGGVLVVAWKRTAKIKSGTAEKGPALSSSYRDGISLFDLKAGLKIL